MNNIRIIDLLNKIAKGDEVPAKIKHWKTEYQKLDDDTLVQYRNKDGYCLDLVQILNDEVEIIEEDKTIEELQFDSEEKYITTITGTTNKMRNIDLTLATKINELVKEINKMKGTNERRK